MCSNSHFCSFTCSSIPIICSNLSINSDLFVTSNLWKHQSTSKHHIWEWRICQEMISKILIICFESSWLWRVEHSLNPSLSYGFYSLLSYSGVHLIAKTIGCAASFWPCLQYYADMNLGWQCSCKIIIVHNISGIISQWVWGNCTNIYWSPCHCGRDTDLTSKI